MIVKKEKLKTYMLIILSIACLCLWWLLSTEKSRNDAWRSKVPTSVTWTFGANEKVMLGLTDRIYTVEGTLVTPSETSAEHAEYFLTPGEYEVFLNVTCQPIQLVQH